LSPERYIRFGSFKSGWLLSLPQAKVTKQFSSIAGGFICLASCGLASRMREAVVEAKNHGSSLGLAGPMTGCRETLPFVAPKAGQVSGGGSVGGVHYKKVVRHAPARRAFGRAEVCRHRVQDILTRLYLQLARHPKMCHHHAKRLVATAGLVATAAFDWAFAPQGEALAIAQSLQGPFRLAPLHELGPGKHSFA
jgi:hypothetical protein